jgi:predicted nucleic acid-binding protein
VRVVVADACSLILLAKCSALRSYAERVTLMAAARAIRECASPALGRRHADAATIAALVDDGLLRVTAVRGRRKLPLALDPGEATTIRLFLQASADRVLSDDGRAIRACRLLGLPFTTSPRVVVDLHAAGAVPLGAARRSLEKLAVVGRYAPEIIAAALTELQEAAHGKTDDNSSA